MARRGWTLCLQIKTGVNDILSEVLGQVLVQQVVLFLHPNQSQMSTQLEMAHRGVTNVDRGLLHGIDGHLALVLFPLPLFLPFSHSSLSTIMLLREGHCFLKEAGGEKGRH